MRVQCSALSALGGSAWPGEPGPQTGEPRSSRAVLDPPDPQPHLNLGVFSPPQRSSAAFAITPNPRLPQQPLTRLLSPQSGPFWTAPAVRALSPCCFSWCDAEELPFSFSTFPSFL